MACITCLVCLASTVSVCHKNILGRVSTRSRHITKLEQSNFLRYLCFKVMPQAYMTSCACAILQSIFVVLMLDTAFKAKLNSDINLWCVFRDTFKLKYCKNAPQNRMCK